MHILILYVVPWAHTSLSPVGSSVSAGHTDIHTDHGTCYVRIAVTAASIQYAMRPKNNKICIYSVVSNLRAYLRIRSSESQRNRLGLLRVKRVSKRISKLVANGLSVRVAWTGTESPTTVVKLITADWWCASHQYCSNRSSSSSSCATVCRPVRCPFKRK